MQNFNNFDPIAFLKINTTGLDEKEIIYLRNFLYIKIGEYILLDISGHLSDEQVKQISLEKDAQSILKRLGDVIPKPVSGNTWISSSKCFFRWHL